MKHLVLGLCALLFVPSFTTSRADMPPPPGYVEQCTVTKQQGDGEHCRECHASFRDPEACTKQFDKTDYARRCRTRGASAWGEVWCRKGDALPLPGIVPTQPEPSPEPPPPEPTPPEPEPSPAPEP